MPPRLIRRRPLSERVWAYLDPGELWLWLSEKLNSGEWDPWLKAWSLPLGVGLNVIFLVARANTGQGLGSSDGVFGDELEYPTLSSSIASLVVLILSIGSFVNAAYTFLRTKRYRLFESPLNKMPATPSAQRVRVESSPVSSSPLRYLSDMLAGETAESRAHPDPTRDVWEIGVWDPTPILLRLSCYLSPGHVIVYWLNLPTSAVDPYPSTTVAKTIFLGVLISAQLSVLCKNFSQQSKDSTLIHKEVMNEYDTKFVHPRTQHQMRDVGTQISTSRRRRSGSPDLQVDDEDVDVYAPTFVINKGFHTRPNPSYAHHTNPEPSNTSTRTSRGASAYTSTPFQTPAHLRDMSSPIQPQTAIRQPQFRPQSRGSDGGNLGVYSHANSPLRKSTSSGMMRGSHQYDRGQSPQRRKGSPLKRNSLAALPNGYPQ